MLCRFALMLCSVESPAVLASKKSSQDTFKYCLKLVIYAQAHGKKPQLRISGNYTSSNWCIYQINESQNKHLIV